MQWRYYVSTTIVEGGVGGGGTMYTIWGHTGHCGHRPLPWTNASI